MQVKPGADFLTDRRSATNNQWRGRKAGKQPSHWGNSHPPYWERKDCFGKIIVPGENPATGTLGILSANHLPLSPIRWDMKTGKVQVGRQGVSLPEGHCTHDNPPRSFIPFILFMLSTRLPAWWGKHIGPLAFEINLTLDLSPQTPDGPCGTALLWGLEERCRCPSPLQTLTEELVINRETTALLANSQARIEMPPQSLLILPCCSLG